MVSDDSPVPVDPLPATIPSDTTAVIFFCHGSRDPRWRESFDQIVFSFRAHYPGVPCALTFLELMTPGLTEVVDTLCARGCRRVRVVPLLLAPGAHSRVDLPALLAESRQRWPDLLIDATTTLTESATLRQAIVDWVVDSLAVDTGAPDTP